MKNLRLLLPLLLCPVLAFTQSYQVDKSFGQAGFTKVDLTDGNELVWSIEITDQNQIMAAGCISPNASSFNYDILMASYDMDGSLNIDYGNEGSKAIDLGRVAEDPYDQITLADGSTLLAGYTTLEAFILKLKPDGTIDQSFANGVGFISYTDVGATADFNQIELQSDGKIIGLTSRQNMTTGNKEPILLRYTADGMLDETFGQNGEAFILNGYTTVFEIGTEDQIYVGSYGGNYVNTSKFTANGLIDPSFGSNGLFAHRFDNEAFLSDLEILQDGTILMVGLDRSSSQNSNISLLMLDNEGQLVSSFGNDGIAKTKNISGEIRNPKLVLLEDGTLAIGGDFRAPSTTKQVLFFTKFSKDGSWESYSNSEDLLLFSMNSVEHFFTDIIADKDDNLYLSFINFGATDNGGIVKLTTSTVSIKDIHLDWETQLFPNPAVNSALLTFTFIEESNVSIDLIDASGKHIQNILPKSVLRTGTHQQEIKISPRFAAGLYFVKIETDKGYKTIPLSIR